MCGKTDCDLVRRQNRLAVLQALRFHGPSARVELGRLKLPNCFVELKKEILY